MLKRLIASLAVSALLLFMASCGGEEYSVTAESELKKYAMTMSSHPGLPINILITGADSDGFEASCTDGVLRYRDDRGGQGAVSDHGDRLSFDKREGRIYWTPDESLREDTVLTVTVLRDGKAVFSQDFTIEYTDDGFFRLSE